MRWRVVAAGLIAAAGVWYVGVAWPVSEGYPSLLHWLGDRIIESNRDTVFDRDALRADLAAQGFAMGDAVHVRILKAEKQLEVWLRPAAADRFQRFRAYDICTFSGDLGPKLAEGDRQAPEGFYRVGLKQLNPNSRHHLSFNLGFPNAFDRQLGRTGSALMVHGGCSSIGCYAITDQSVDEVYALVEAALRAGQDAVDVHVFPFAMTEAALTAQAGSTWASFWDNLKQGYDSFEASGAPPKVAACDGAYVFGTDAEKDGCVPIAAWS